MKAMKRSIVRVLYGLGLLALIQAAMPDRASAQDQQAVPDNLRVGPQGEPIIGAAASDDDETTMRLNMNNVNFDQLLNVMKEVTGKPVIPGAGVEINKLTIANVGVVTRRQALELIYDALQLHEVVAVEYEDRILLVKPDALSSLRVETFERSTDLRAAPDSLRMGRMIYQPRYIGADELSRLLRNVVPRDAMTSDDRSGTLILTDQITRLKGYDLIIRSLDTEDPVESEVAVFKLEHANAIELSTLLASIMLDPAYFQTDSSGRPDERYREAMRSIEMASRSRSSSSRYSSREQGMVIPLNVGDTLFVPDPRMNWLFVTGPKRVVDEVRKWVEELDQKPVLDVQARFIPMKHIEAAAAASVVQNLFQTRAGSSAKDVIRAIPSDDGTNLVVMSSKINFDTIQEIIGQLDTAEAEKKETRRYEVEHVEVQELADNLQLLFDEARNNSQANNYPFFIYTSRPRQSEVQPTFVPYPRNNTLMVLAKPRDFDVIEEMIEELDVEVDPERFEPHTYRIRHTDATVLADILESLFEGTVSSRRSQNDFFFRPTNSSNQRGSLAALYGEVKLEVDHITNTIVALSSNPMNYTIIENLIAELDSPDEEMTRVFVYDLKHARAVDIASHINNIFSDNPVNQPRTQGGGSNNQNNEDDDQNAARTSNQVFVTETGVVMPWQYASRNQGQGEQEERTLNAMIGNVRTIADTRTNQIIAVTPPIYFNALKMMIEDLDQPEPRVYIKTRIVEIIRGNERRIGIRWTPDPSRIDPAELDNALLGLAQLGFLDSFGNTRNGRGDALTPLDTIEVQTQNRIGSVTRNVTTSLLPGNTVLSADVNVALLLQLLVRNSNTQIIAEPELVMNNNERGELFVGQELPFRENTLITDTGGQSEGVERQEVGLSLNITPHINADGRVVLSIELENSVSPAPEIINRTRFNTELAVESGQTMFIGGILLDNEDFRRDGIPFLSDIPFIGRFFTKNDRAREIRELAVFITPLVLKDREDDDAVTGDAEERIAKTQEEIHSED